MTKVEATTSGELSLQAIYESTVYHVTTDLDGGTLPDGVTISTEYKYKQSNIVLPQDVTKQGHSFAGWYLEDEDVIVTRIDTTKAMDYHLRALWSSNASTTKIAGTVESDGTEKEIPYAEKPMESNQWYYNRLTDVEKKIYTTIYNYYKFDMDKGECRMENVKVVTKDKITIANMYQASTAVVLDNPSIFWIRYFNHTQMKEKDGVYTGTIHPVLAYYKTAFQADALEYGGFLQEIIKSLNNSGVQKVSTAKKLKLIHDYVVKTYSYRNNSHILSAAATNETRSVGYLMTHKEGCCESYAKMIKILCDYYQIPCVTVYSLTHMWNQVKIGNQWYLLDATWDDEEPVVYTYFLKGAKSVIDEHHIVTSMFFSDCQGNGIKDYANYSVPTLSKEDYVEPVNPTPNNSQTAPKKSKVVTSATKGKVVYAISGKYAVVKKCTSKKVKSVTILNKVKIGKKTYTVTSIAKNAFKGCKKLKKVTIKATKLKSIGKNAFKGIYKKATFKVPKKQLKKYKKLIKKKKTGFKKTMKVK